MQQDLERYFDLDVKIEKRKVKSLVLVRTSNIDKMGSKHPNGVDSPEIPVDFTFNGQACQHFQNLLFGNFTSKLKSWIQSRRTSIPFFDATRYSGRIDMVIRDFSVENLSIEEIRIDLAKYDLGLEEQERELDVLIIREKGSSSVK